jgi:hypothetical protein
LFHEFHKTREVSRAGLRLITDNLNLKISNRARLDLKYSEIRWHYSQHFLSESYGEEVLEDIMSIAVNAKQRNLLNSQLCDERDHAKLFKTEVDRIGFDSRADLYAKGYSELVRRQESFSEKVFVFQILTEAISAAYCQWRICSIQDARLNKLDKAVESDEIKHLVMGGALLDLCDPDELNNRLSNKRQKSLIHEMNSLCRKAIRQSMFECLVDMNQVDNPNSIGITSLDRYIVKSVIQEYKKINKRVLK